MSNYAYYTVWNEITYPFPNLMSNYAYYTVWNEITYPFPNFNGCTIEV